MISHRHLSAVFAALATAISLSMCCPIGQCAELPIASYFQRARHHSPLQGRVNVSTTENPAFHPQNFLSNIQNAAGNTVQTNGCEGFFNHSSSDAGVDTPCPWRYQCDYNPQRIPALIFSARCDSATPQGSAGEGDAVCDEVHYPITYIMTTSCNPLEEMEDTEWKLVTSVIPVSCNLQRWWDITFLHMMVDYDPSNIIMEPPSVVQHH